MKKLIISIILSIFVMSIIIISFIIYRQQPTIDEINQLQLFYKNYEQSVNLFPTDKGKIEKIYDISKYIFDNEIFFKAFDDTDYYAKYKKMKDNSYYVIKPKKYFQKQLYDEAIFFHLKILLSLDYYDEYNVFFLKYYQHFVDSIEVEFCDYLFNDDGFKLSKQDITTIIHGYNNALNYCDNDIDKFVVLQDICEILEKSKKQEKTYKIYLEQINDLLDKYEREQFVKDYSKWKGFTSKKLTN